MKTTANVFLIISLVICVFLFLAGNIYLAIPVEEPDPDIIVGATFFVIYGFYGIAATIMSLCAVGGHSKNFVVVSGIFYLPVSFIASIFMFCIDKDDLNVY